MQWLKSKIENDQVVRWEVKLSEFDLEIQHRKGRKSADVTTGSPANSHPRSYTYGARWM